MRVLGYQVENYMRVRLLEVRPKGRITQITGKNGQGKTSAVRALFDALRGKRSQPEMPVRKGAEKARIWAGLGDEKIDLHLRLSVLPGGQRTLTIETAQGESVAKPQEVLDRLMENMPGDPLEFMKMPAKEQVEVLRRLVKVDVDIEEMNAANAVDYEARAALKKDLARLEAEAQGIVVQANLPAEKLDEGPIRAKMAAATETNANAKKLDEAKREAAFTLETKQARIDQLKDEALALQEAIEKAQHALAQNIQARHHFQPEIDALRAEYNMMPDGELVDVSALSEEMDQVRVTNKAIEQRDHYQALQLTIGKLRGETMNRTRAMEGREEKKREAIAKAKMPVDGMTFDDDAVKFKGIPLAQLGEAEQLKVCCQVFMSGKQQLRILPIWHGEALDDDNLKMLEALCEEYDFHILMARVDSSGKVGIVMEDGEGRVAE